MKIDIWKFPHRMLGTAFKKIKSNGMCMCKTLFSLITTSEHKIQSEPKENHIETNIATLTVISTPDGAERFAAVLPATNSMQEST